MIAPAGAFDPSNVALESAEIRRLVSIGFHGALNGKPEAAQRLFENLEVLRPDAGFPRIGCALTLLARGRAEEAVRLLECALLRHPDDEDMRVFLGLALRMANRGRQAGAVLSSVAQCKRESAGTRLAQQLLTLTM
jgi:predicted Zn-dependent protease